MPLVSVFTPSHDVTYLEGAYQSLLAQDYDDWEWVVLLNGEDLRDFFWEEPYSADDRIRVLHTNQVDGVGDAKNRAVQHCTGSILVELDHDDELEPTCLSELVRAFQDHPTASLVYSSFAHMDSEGNPEGTRFGPDYGWRYETQDGFHVPHVLEPTPHNVSLIWYAPNHVRAFTRRAYDKAGGYDSKLEVLDDLDLMARLYRVGEFVPVDKFLYRQRLHEKNTQFDREINTRIQSDTWQHYEKNIRFAAHAWASRNELEVFDNFPLSSNWNPGPSSVGLVRTMDLHRWSNPEAAMEQIHHVLAPNGMFMAMLPYWGEEFFKNITTGNDAPFQVSRLRTFWEAGIPYVQANLIAVKDGYVRDGGPLNTIRELVET